MPLTFTVLRCPNSVAPETRTVSGGEYSVGRGPGVDWVLPDPERLLSKHHFAVAYRSGSWQVADTSTNGTFMNAETDPIGRNEVRTLRDGDRVKLGAYEIEIRLAEDAYQPAGGGMGFGGPAHGGSPFGDPFGGDPLAPPPPPRPAFGGNDFVSPQPPTSAQLPMDFDPLAPDLGEEPFHGPTQADHSSLMEDAFQPPAVTGQMPLHTGGQLPGDDLLPDDWDKDLLEGIAPAAPAAPNAPRQAPASAPRPAPPPPQAFAPPPVPPVAQPVTQPAAQPAVQPIVQRVAQPVVQPVVQRVVQPVAQPVAEPVQPPVTHAPAPAAEPPNPFDEPFELEAREEAPSHAPVTAAPEPTPFDEPFGAAAPAPPVVAPVPAPAPRPAPPVRPTAAPPAPVAPPAQAASQADDSALLAAFLDGVGLGDAHPRDPTATMRALGEAFRTLVSGLRAVLIARASIKSEFRIEQTMIRAHGNNPLKFSAGDDDALGALLGTGRRTDMTPAAAIADALKDIRLHELASMAAMQSAVRSLMDGLSPEKVRAQAEQSGGLSVLPAQRKARAWDAYEALHNKTVQALSDDFDSVFGKAFARAYEQAMDEVSAKER